MDARKLKEKATEAFAKGKFAKAAEAYADYCAADPKDLQARLRMGDAWVKAGQKQKAIGAYEFAAEGFAKEGFLPRAIAASKLILELDPTHQGVQKMLADLYARKTGPAAASRPKTAATIGAVVNHKHAPIDLPKADEAPLEIEESRSFKKNDAPPQPETVVAIEVEGPTPSGAELELDVSVTGGGVAPLPPPPPPPSEKVEVATIELEVEPPEAPKPPAAPSGSAAQSTPKGDGAAPVYELDDEPLTAVKSAPEKPPTPSEESGRFKRTTSGAYELDVEPVTAGQGAPEKSPPPSTEESGRIELATSALRPGPPAAAAAQGGPAEYELEVEAEPAVVGQPEKSQLQIAEESGRFKRTTSGAYELDLDDAPVDADPEQPVELTQPKAPPPAPIDEAKLVAELATPEPIAALVRPPSAGASAPPGLKSRRPEPEGPAASRLWFPNNVVSAPSSEQSQAKMFTAPLRGGPQTDLERSLAAFAKFDDEIQIIEPPAEEPARQKPAARTFTELELEGDSLLHAVEAAASIGLEQRGQLEAPVVEERMEAPEEQKPEPGALPKIPLFSDLPEDAFIALFERCPLRRFEPTDRVIQQGSLGDSFFVICAGSVKVFRTDGEVRRDIATLNEGAFFGEMALLSGAARTASVEAGSEDTQLLEISAPILTELSLKYPPVAQALKKFCRQRLLTNVMGSSALFAPFSRTERRQLVERFRAREVQKGDVLIKEGQRSDGMYIVLSGEVEVRLGRHAVATLKEGDIFGEMSLLTKAPATATCAAARRTSLLRLPREDFDQIVLSHPQILVLVSELTDERNKQNAALASRAPKPAGEAMPMV